MSDSSDAGNDVVEGTFGRLEIDDEWSISIRRDFAWWGHRLRQRIWSTSGYDDDGIVIHRVFVVSDLVRNIKSGQSDVDQLLGPMGALAIGSARVFDPTEKTIRLWTAVTVHAEIVEWMISLFSSLAIIQAIEAANRAEITAEVVGGDIDLSAHPSSGERSEADEMMHIVDNAFIPAGQRPSPWSGSEELDQIRESLNKLNCFSTGNRTGLTAEFPIGSTTSMMQVITGEKNPVIGSGVGILLQLPLWGSAERAAMMAGVLNRAEANRHTPGHLIGSWCSKTIGERSNPTFASFIPAALYQPGLLTNLVFSAAVRAQWVGRTLNPDADPEHVMDILFSRFQDWRRPTERHRRIRPGRRTFDSKLAPSNGAVSCDS